MVSILLCYTNCMTKGQHQIKPEPTKDVIHLTIDKCAAVILKYQQPNGAYPASPNFTPYKYCWFRDGAFIADGMSRIGQIESAERFFDWCSKIIIDRRDRILNGDKLDARYTYDGKESTEEWATFQL